MQRAILTIRLSLAGLLLLCGAWAAVSEAAAWSLLVQARAAEQRSDHAQAASRCRQLMLQYPLATVTAKARRLHEKVATQPIEQPPIGTSIMSRLVTGPLSPLRVDWLLLLGPLGCGIVLAAVCVMNVRRSVTLAAWSWSLMIVATAGTLLIWSNQGLAPVRWTKAPAAWLDGLLSHRQAMGVAVWLLIIATSVLAVQTLCDRPVRRESRPRPSTPTDPRMALIQLNAQRAEGRYSAEQYARQREAILSRL